MAEQNGVAIPAAPPASTGFTPQDLRVFSALLSRATLASRMGVMFDGKRRIPDVLGYRTALGYKDYLAYYERGDIANRLVKAYPEATWSQVPTVQEDDQDDAQTPFEAAWVSLVARLGLFAKLERADILGNLGQYAIVLIGLRGQPDLAQPARPVRSPDDVLYLSPYSEQYATIERFDTAPASPRFGLPLLYRLNFSRTGEPDRREGGTRRGLVHASRVLHVAEDLLEDEVYGIPRLKPVYNKLDDLLKVCGGAAEMFYRDAKRRIALEIKEDHTLSAEAAKEMNEEIEDYMHGLQDFIRLEGVTAKDLSGLVASPRDHYDVLLSLISGTTGIPKRILTGSERGELASSQDERAWLQRINRRQQQYAEARILRPLIDLLLALGALPAPAAPYQVIWDNLFALGEQEQAAVAREIATAANAMSPGMPERVVPIGEYRVRYLGLSAESDYEIDLSMLPDTEEEAEEDAEEDAEEPEDGEETEDAENDEDAEDEEEEETDGSE